jgi:hypothetical protein
MKAKGKTKICTRCKEKKIIESDFYTIKIKVVNATGATVVYPTKMSWCKVCQSDHVKKNRSEKKEYFKNYRKEYQLDNYDKVSKYGQLYYQLNKKFWSEYQKLYHLGKKDIVERLKKQGLRLEGVYAKKKKNNNQNKTK